MQANKAGGQWRPYLELVRPPALLTAAADSLAGWAWVVSVINISASTTQLTLSLHSVSWSLVYFVTPCLLGLVSAMVYAAGMATNDLFDYEEDLRDRPFRPLPSGRVSIKEAWSFALLLQLSSIGTFGILLYLWGSRSIVPLGVCLTTILMTYLYNRVFKDTLVAPLLMGLCRFGNFWIGASLIYAFPLENEHFISTLDFTLPLLASLGTLIYVSALTALSRFETTGGTMARVWGGVLLMMSTHPLWWYGSGILLEHTLLKTCSLLIITLSCTLWLGNKMKGLLRGDTSEQQVQLAVGSGIRGVALGNICLCILFGYWSLAMVIFIMALAAGRVARWFYAT